MTEEEKAKRAERKEVRGKKKQERAERRKKLEEQGLNPNEHRPINYEGRTFEEEMHLGKVILSVHYLAFCKHCNRTNVHICITKAEDTVFGIKNSS